MENHISMKNHERGNNISATSVFKWECTTHHAFMKKSSFMENHKRGNKVSTAGAFYKRRMYNQSFFCMKKNHLL